MEPDSLSRQNAIAMEMTVFLAAVLRDIAPHEAPAFGHVGLATIRRAMNLETMPLPGARSITGIVELGVIALHLVAGTLALIETYRRQKELKEHSEFQENIQQEWQKALIEAGMPYELARQVPVKYCAEMIQFIVAQRLGKPSE